MKTDPAKIDLRPRKRPAQERSRETIEQILSATADLLEAGGASAVTTNKIASSAQISVGSLYQFFPNKQSIYATLFDRQLQKFAEQVTPYFAPEYDSQPVDEFITRVIDAVGKAYLSIPALATLLVTMQTDPALDNISLANRDAFAERMQELLKRRYPRVKTAETRAAAVVIVETVNAVFRRWMALRDRPAQARPLLIELKANLSLYLGHRFEA